MNMCFTESDASFDETFAYFKGFTVQGANMDCVCMPPDYMAKLTRCYGIVTHSVNIRTNHELPENTVLFEYGNSAISVKMTGI